MGTLFPPSSNVLIINYILECLRSQTIAHLLDTLPIAVREILSPIFKYGLSERLFKKLTVEELLWGYPDELLKIVSKFVTIPGMPNGEFGFLVGVS